MQNFENIIFLLAVLISLSALVERFSFRIPQPIVLVVAGLLIGFIPSLPDLALDPQTIFLIFLPPLLFNAASQTSWHDFRADIRPISALAISLVFFTILVVAITAHYLVPDFGWSIAFLLGAIISPTDAVATSSIIKGLNLDRRIMTIIEGESLANDASALIAYRHALIAVLTGSFVFVDAGLQFLLVASGGIVIGLIIGYLLVLIHKRINNNVLVETGLNLLTPYIAYLTAEHLQVSGILSVVSTGLMISWRAPEIFAFQTRMRTRVIWDTLVFLLNGFVFILIGLQLPAIIKQVQGYPTWQLIGSGMVISVATIIVRIIWVYAGAYVTNMFLPKNEEGEKAESTPWKHVLVIAWTGTRGVLSLALALALPLTLNAGKIFPQRPMILFLTFVVIFVTLVVQGLTLPLLIRWLKIKPDASEGRERKELQLHMINSVLHFIDNELSVSLDDDLQQELKNKYNARAARISKEISIHKKNEKVNGPPTSTLLTPLMNAQMEIAKFQRELLVKLHKGGEYSDTAIKEIEREMDIDELKLAHTLPKEDEQPT